MWHFEGSIVNDCPSGHIAFRNLVSRDGHISAALTAQMAAKPIVIIDAAVRISIKGKSILPNKARTTHGSLESIAKRTSGRASVLDSLSKYCRTETSGCSLTSILANFTHASRMLDALIASWLLGSTLA